MARKLTGKQKLFVEYYMTVWDAARAARMAGYDGPQKELIDIGQENLSNPAILKAIKDGKTLPARYCQACGQILIQNEVENIRIFKIRKHCDAKCAEHRDRPDGWNKNHSEARKHKKEFCEACGMGINLHAHHIDGNPKNNTDVNIQTLCTWCHHFIHALMVRLELETPGRMPKLLNYD